MRKLAPIAVDVAFFGSHMRDYVGVKKEFLLMLHYTK